MQRPLSARDLEWIRHTTVLIRELERSEQREYYRAALHFAANRLDDVHARHTLYARLAKATTTKGTPHP